MQHVGRVQYCIVEVNYIDYIIAHLFVFWTRHIIAINTVYITKMLVSVSQTEVRIEAAVLGPMRHKIFANGRFGSHTYFNDIFEWCIQCVSIFPLAAIRVYAPLP